MPFAGHARVGGPLLWALLAALILVWPGAAAVHAQGASGASPQLYLLPGGTTDLVLETHLADLRLLAGDPAAAVMDATYRLKNPTEADVVLPLRLVPAGDTSLSSFQGLALSANGEPLALEDAGDGSFTSQVWVGAGGRATLRLVYQVGLGSGPLAAVRYVPAVLNQWPGNISLRVQMLVPEAIPSASWLEIAPDGWSYGVTSDPTEISIKWLYDASIPDTAFVLRFVAPGVWAQLTEAEQAAAPGSAPANFVRLGDLYRRLYRAATDDGLRTRFYAQAVAAYSAGLQSGAAAAAPQDQAALHTGLAQLYRDRLVEAEAGAQREYAQILVDETGAALALLPADDARRAELAQWQADGLAILLGDARRRGDWPEALALVDQMAQLPAGVVDLAKTAAERRAILLQQALALMEQGNREAALAVAGDQIATEEVATPADALPLFASWNVTVTAQPDALRLEAFGLTTEARHAEALAALQEVVRMWEQGVAQAERGRSGYAFDVTDVQPPQESGNPSGVALTVEFPLAANGFLLARLLPQRADWAFLQTLLTQLAPTTSRTRELVWEQITLSQPMNLAPATSQWLGVASGLEQEAAGFEAAGASGNAGDPDGAARALRAQVQAVNYRAAAAEWRRLAEQSWLLFNFEAADPLFDALNREQPQRSWVVTGASPSQMFVLRAQVLDTTRMMALGASAFMALIAAAGVLWWLL